MFANEADMGPNWDGATKCCALVRQQENEVGRPGPGGTAEPSARQEREEGEAQRCAGVFWPGHGWSFRKSPFEGPAGRRALKRQRPPA